MDSVFAQDLDNRVAIQCQSRSDDDRGQKAYGLPAILRSIAILILAGTCVTGCKKWLPAGSDLDRQVDEDDDPEEQDDRLDNVWRARIAIVGDGRVKSTTDAFDCATSGSTQGGACGPTLIRFKERQPPLLRAIAASGWRFDHWDSEILEPDGSKKRRTGPMPDGALYLNGFGYADTGELETVTALFEPATPEEVNVNAQKRY